MGLKLSNIIPTSEQLTQIRGIENTLLKRRRRGEMSGLVALVGAITEVLTTVFTGNNMLTKIGTFLQNITTFNINELLEPQYTGMFVVTGLLSIYFVLRWTSFLLKESKEAFRYTFWIMPFKHVRDTDGARFQIEAEDRFHHLVHHDLIERLNERIRRLSLLNVEKLDAATRTGLSSHIHIEGNYTIREAKDGKWIIHVMPRIGIGPPGNPLTLANSVKFEIAHKVGQCKLQLLDTNKYNQIIERIYSSVATEIYRQIEIDIKGKISLFPTPYLRAVALFHEAEDFVRSNTIDAYDRAIELYREALRYFNITNIEPVTRILIKLPILWRLEVKFVHMWARVNIGYAKCLIYRRQISALSGRYKNPLFEIPCNLENVICYLRQLHEKMAGRYMKQIIFGILEILRKFNDIIIGIGVSNKKTLKAGEHDRLKLFTAFLNFPNDSWFRYAFLRPLQPLFEKQRRLFFDACIVTALAHYFLGAVEKAKGYLKCAKAVDPQLSGKNPLYLLAAGAIEPDLDKEILLFRKASELAPDFQIAQFFLAQYSEMRFRMKNEINRARASSVLADYEQVLKINPGNVAALAAQGYLLWLLANYDEAFENSQRIHDGKWKTEYVAREFFNGDMYRTKELLKNAGGPKHIACEIFADELNKAKDKFEEGCNLKAIVRETFIGELNYGLARCAAEEGRFNSSYDLYTQAISADPGVGAYSISATQLVNTSYYEYMVPNMLDRYQRFKTRVEGFFDGKLTLDENDGEVSDRIRKAVYSFALNDYGNACLNFYFRFGDDNLLKEAMKAFGEAVRNSPQNFVAKYNLSGAYQRKPNKSDKERAMKLLKEVIRNRPTWQAAVLSLTLSHVRSPHVEDIQEKIDKRKKQISELVKRIEEEEKMTKISRQTLKDYKDQAEVWNQTEISKKGLRIDDTYYDAEISRAENRINKYQEQIKLSKKELEKLEENLRDLFSRAIGSIMENTKLSSLFEGLRIDHEGTGVARLSTDRRSKWYRLDEDDVQALRAWAEVLSSNFKSKVALRASKKLCYLVHKYYPDDFDTDCVLNAVYHHLLGSPLFRSSDMKDMPSMARKLIEAKDALSSYLQGQLSSDARRLLDDYDASVPSNDALRKSLIAELNRQLRNESLYDRQRFRDVILKEDTKKIINTNPFGTNLMWLNRLLLEEAYPQEIEKSQNREVFTEGIICFMRINNTISNVLAQDPIYYDVLRYSRYFHNFAERVSLLNRALQSNAASELTIHNHLYCNMLGEIYHEEDNYDEAIANYSEANKINPSVAIIHSNLASVYKKLEKWEEATSEYEKAHELEPGESKYRNMLASTLNMEGNEYFARADYQKAIEKYNRAISLDASEAVYHSNLAYALENLSGVSEGRLENLKQAISSLRKALDLNPNDREYADRLNKLERMKGVGDHYGPNALNRWPVVTPIAIEMAGDLTSYMEKIGKGKLPVQLERHIEDMRERILETFGVRVPGIRFRGNETDLPDGTYIIMIMEIPLVSGNISLEKRLCTRRAEDLTRFGILGERTTNPQTDDEAVWIIRKDWGKAETTGLKLWDIIEYPVRHLELVIQRNLPEFLGHQEVLNLLEDAKVEAYKRMKNSPRQLTALTQILKALVREEVPIKNLGEICDRFEEQSNAESDSLTIAESIRSLPKVRAVLPGNNDQHSFYQLGKNFEAEIKKSILRKNATPILAMEPEKCQRALVVLRDQMLVKKYVALLVEEAELRPFVQKLIELELPNVPVLSQNELLDDLKKRILGKIEMR